MSWGIEMPLFSCEQLQGLKIFISMHTFFIGVVDVKWNDCNDYKHRKLLLACILWHELSVVYYEVPWKAGKHDLAVWQYLTHILKVYILQCLARNLQAVLKLGLVMQNH